jgi:Transposase DDE domain group 1
MTECIPESFAFAAVGTREVVARFDGGHVVSDGGALLLGEVERQTGILHRFAACFTDQRDPLRIEHTVEQLIRQRIYALALGYEDLSDHDQLRRDPLLAVLAGKAEPTQELLAGKSTLNRLELTRPLADAGQQRYKRILFG